MISLSLVPVHGKRYAYKFDFQGLAQACQNSISTGNDISSSVQSFNPYQSKDEDVTLFLDVMSPLYLVRSTHSGIVFVCRNFLFYVEQVKRQNNTAEFSTCWQGVVKEWYVRNTSLTNYTVLTFAGKFFTDN
ncbi:hypothetical protein DICVIV_06352 [Dictyocaulus viviparus]|uniref:Uncharacterized protein n=1 Tax=Dictyocaulus viviparus TaxID=29172 RepID=A0A0D8XYX3_DICVI|nr:hypothetical protein DICVIV_06352 [Dictyocaulus viviparus]